MSMYRIISKLSKSVFASLCDVIQKLDIQIEENEKKDPTWDWITKNLRLIKDSILK